MLTDVIITKCDNAPHTLFDWLYVSFNWVEAASWMGIAIFIAMRFFRERRTRLELVYALSFVAFGFTDVLEVYELTVGLLLVKALVLMSILVCRYHVLRAYTERKILL
ncbi:hypothetical protein Rhal01_02477 [Rubritalea halochordaticola]|uniref:Uncharacterized protein n=1 Tax=Rubritalea halochordaticola TaxID=714537 RepID=A0ABP9V3X8_9BACT